MKKSKHRSQYTLKRRETSKILLWCVLVICFLFLSIIVGAWALYDRSDAGVIASIFALPITAVIIWYYNKAKAENLLKIRKSIMQDSAKHLDEESYNEMMAQTNADFIDNIDKRIVDLHSESSNHYNE